MKSQSFLAWLAGVCLKNRRDVKEELGIAIHWIGYWRECAKQAHGTIHRRTYLTNVCDFRVRRDYLRTIK